MYESAFGPDMRFIHAMHGAASVLQDLLGVRMISGLAARSLYLLTRFEWVLRLHNEGQFRERDAEIFKLQFLAKHLTEIRDFNQAAFAHYRRELRKCYEAKQYFGLRNEIYVAAGLARRRIEYIRRESPDFEVVLGGRSFIECGSAHFTKSVGRVHEKVLAVVNQKARKPYATPEVCLVVDHTNVLHNGVANESEFDSDTLRGQLRQVLAGGTYGAVILVCHYLNDGGIGTAYVRVDAELVAPPLAALLERFYPWSAVTDAVAWIPNLT